MSLLSWLWGGKRALKASHGLDPSGLSTAEATRPLAPGSHGKAWADAGTADHAANRKAERMERRELLYAVVRDTMTRAGVLSASYKFKVLSLDAHGQQFLVMMDLGSEYGGDTARLSEIEVLMAQTAKARHDILVTAVYWRNNDHVAVGNPQKRAVPGAAAAAPASSIARPIAATPSLHGAAAPAGPRPAAVSATARFDPIEAEEVAAFKRALAGANSAAAPVAGGTEVRSGPRNPLRKDFEDTEMTDHGESRPQSLSTTQYGDLV
ncbi:hypothetical protein PY257_14230 [Ramlibacter sp. H39-3-26]|uniref:hypothetical protein n=1 Tax=Curvibacter soli TaxID=3031331 RepID=UPI0023DC59F9|nr:hypothetical protein [Ramlibacter sp. H39-3-26]MDF1486320.1 hypothetical protein [Ramlibacter sp. H39-3-26]